MKSFGKRVATVWKGLRPTTRKMIVGALELYRGEGSSPPKKKYLYDTRADWELSRLLTVLDEQTTASETREDEKKFIEISQLAETCAGVLEAQTESAEVFIQLAARAVRRSDFDQIDHLGGILMERFPVSEIAEIIRQSDLPQIQALAYEALAVRPPDTLVPLLRDPAYSGIAANSLEQQAVEFGSVEAESILVALELGDDHKR